MKTEGTKFHRGTPKSLTEAIRNALEQAEAIRDVYGEEYTAKLVEIHVRDFLAQKFCVPMMNHSAVVEPLWIQVTGKTLKKTA